MHSNSDSRRSAKAKASATAVQTILGHRSAAFTLTVYGRIFDTDLGFVETTARDGFVRDYYILLPKDGT